MKTRTRTRTRTTTRTRTKKDKNKNKNKKEQETFEREQEDEEQHHHQNQQQRQERNKSTQTARARGWVGDAVYNKATTATTTHQAVRDAGFSRSRQVHKPTKPRGAGSGDLQNLTDRAAARGFLNLTGRVGSPCPTDPTRPDSQAST